VRVRATAAAWRIALTGLLSARDLALVDAVARRVLELLDAREHVEPSRLVDASALARMLGVARSTVYEHAGELGAVQLGDGRRARLRFNPERAVEAWTRRSVSKVSQAPDSAVAAGVSRSRRRRSLGSGVVLLPVRDAEARREGG
jgi:DNA-binding transcriptional ArsR family regulator